MLDICIEKINGELEVSSPFNIEFITKARMLNGTWIRKRKKWIFDCRDEEKVRKICVDIYGTDGSEILNLVTVRCCCKHGMDSDKSGIFIGPVCVARAFGRDTGARLFPGVVVEKGGFFSSGSIKNWTTSVHPGTVIEVRDIPMATVLLMKKQSNWEIEVTYGDIGEGEFEFFDYRNDNEYLIKERDELLTRVAEIEKILEGGE